MVQATCASASDGLACLSRVCLVLLKPSHFLVQALPILTVLHDRCIFATWDEVHDLVVARVVEVVGVRTERAAVSLAPQEAHFSALHASTATAAGTMEGFGVFETFRIGLRRAHLLDLLPGGEYGCNIGSRSDASYVLLLLLEFFLLLFPEEGEHLPIRRLLLLHALAALRALLLLVSPLDHVDFEDELSNLGDTTRALLRSIVRVALLRVLVDPLLRLLNL